MYNIKKRDVNSKYLFAFPKIWIYDVFKDITGENETGRNNHET
jgi:hypothetical protein